MQIGPLIVDYGRLSVTVEEKPVPLSSLQMRLLMHLARHPGRVFTRQELLMRVWDEHGAKANPKSVDIVVCRLKKKLGKAGGMIKSVRSHGYVFER